MTGVRKQCKGCPWRVDADPRKEIPRYCPTKHAKLEETLAPGLSGFQRDELRVMACHETPTGKEKPCVGWLENQLGPGNNIVLRIAARDGRFGRFETIGEQHQRLSDTLPRRGEERSCDNCGTPYAVEGDEGLCMECT